MILLNICATAQLEGHIGRQGLRGELPTSKDLTAFLILVRWGERCGPTPESNFEMNVC